MKKGGSATLFFCLNVKTFIFYLNNSKTVIKSRTKLTKPCAVKRMTKSELIEKISSSQDQLPPRDVEQAVRMILERMALTLSNNQRVEIRGFGSFSLHYRAARIGRNPKTGDAVDLRGKYVPYFKPGKELRTRVDKGI